MHLLLGLSEVCLLKELNQMLGSIVKLETLDPNQWRTALIYFVGLSLVFVSPAIAIICLMYRKPQVIAFQIKLWHFSSLYVASSVSVLALAMILYTFLIYRNVN